MRLLVLGGTKFLGRHLVETALARGHAVTLFNRGETSPNLFSEAEKLRGDRDGGLDPLRGQSWDAVVDTSGYIDARDLGEWILRMAESRRTGVYNATRLGDTMGRLLEECRAVSGSDARLVSVTDELLVEQGVGEWMELPLWIADPAWRGHLAADVSKAIAAGLTFRPLAETIADTLAEAASVDGVGLSPERERELLEAWRRRR